MSQFQVGSSEFQIELKPRLLTQVWLIYTLTWNLGRHALDSWLWNVDRTKIKLDAFNNNPNKKV